MTAGLYTWGPWLTLTYGLKLSDLRQMTLREIEVYIDFAQKRARDQGSDQR